MLSFRNTIVSHEQLLDVPLILCMCTGSYKDVNFIGMASRNQSNGSDHQMDLMLNVLLLILVSFLPASANDCKCA